MILLISTVEKGIGRDVSKLPTFTETELFHIYDVFDEKYIAEIIRQKGRPKAILSDHILFFDSKDIFNINFYGLPLWAMRECRRWNKKDFNDDLTPPTDYNFNFMINKKQCSRFILIKLVEIGGYKNFQYTWSGIGRTFDMSRIIEEINLLSNDSPINSHEFRTNILSPITMPLRFIDENLVDLSDSEELSTKHGYKNYGGNKWTWDNFLHDLFTRSCVSLISETGNYNKLAVITEKTLYAFFGLTFPLWIGNYAQAHAIEQIGLDVFNDVINHDYQWYPTLIERCYWAVELNKKILSDLGLAKRTREKHFDRLLSNRQFLLSDGLGMYCDQQIQGFPVQYRDPAALVKQKFDRTKFNML